MKNFLIIFLFLASFTFAQVDTSSKVVGLVLQGNEVYLMMEDGFLLIENSDPYEEYYRKIYNDSTIVNPNTELKPLENFQIIPFLNPNSFQKRMDFQNPYNLGVFVQETNSGIIITETAQEFLTKFKNSQNDILFYPE